MSPTQVQSQYLKGSAQQVLDSRGKPTVSVQLELGACIAIGDVPAGASKGVDEAQTVSVPQAIQNIERVLLPKLCAANFQLDRDQDLIAADKLLAELAGPHFGTLGANATLPVSRALWRLGAQLHNMPLHRYIRRQFLAYGQSISKPALASKTPQTDHVAFLMNIFNGGLHALRKGETLGHDRIDIQEIMVVPRAKTYRKALEMGEAIDAALKKRLLKDFAADRISRADEAGFSVHGLGDSSKAFAYVLGAIGDAGFEPGKDAKLALDVAASSFFDAQNQVYRFGGQDLSSDAMVDYLVNLVAEHPSLVMSIEDGLDENDWEGWRKLTAALKPHGVATVGDDLFVTQLPRLQQGIEIDAADAILIKVNQNGTVWGTLEVMHHAQQHGMASIVSHRSGETLDDSISDLAYATKAWGLKTGDPQPEADFPDPKTWVRRQKYLRMVSIEDEDSSNPNAQQA